MIGTEELRFTPKDILLKRDIDFINKVKLDKEYQARTKNLERLYQTRTSRTYNEVC